MASEPNWERHWDEDSKSYYYFDPVTDASQWDVPEGWEEYFAEKDAEAAAVTDENEYTAQEQDGDQAATAVGDIEHGTVAAQDAPESEAVEQESHDSVMDQPKASTATSSPTTPWAEPEVEQGAARSPSGEDIAEDSRGGDGEGVDDSGGHSYADAYAPAEVPDDTAKEKSCPWIRSQAEDGAIFYYNEVTEESSWDEPEEYRRFHDASQASTAPVSSMAEEVDGADAAAGARDDESYPVSPPPEDLENGDQLAVEPVSPAGGEEYAGTPSSRSSEDAYAPVQHPASPHRDPGATASTPLGARRTRRGAAAKSPSLSPGAAAGGADSYSPNDEWRGGDVRSPSRSPGGSFAGMSPEGRGEALGDGFTVEEDAEEDRPPHDDGEGGVEGRPGQDSGVEREGDSSMALTGQDEEMEDAAEEGGAKASDGLSREERLENAEKEVAALERRVSCSSSRPWHRFFRGGCIA